MDVGGGEAMKTSNLILALFLALGSVAYGAETPTTPETKPEAEAPQSLDAELQKLSTEANTAPAAVTPEKLYAVQYRYAPLKYRHEISVGGAMNFTPESYLSSQQLDLAYRFYLSDRWFLGLAGSYVFNSLTKSGERLLKEVGRIPDATYTKYRADLAVGYNLFYGKFRLSMDTVFYFDNYLSIGPGLVRYGNGTQYGVVGDVGLVGWIGKNFSIRIGLKDYFVKEVRQKSSGMAHNLLGHVELGYLL
jgi:outer membrane beta-barrel protein